MDNDDVHYNHDEFVAAQREEFDADDARRVIADQKPREKRMTKRMLHDSIALIPGADGWWQADGGDTYRKLGDALIARGFTTDEALAFLESAYGAAASEFGQ